MHVKSIAQDAGSAVTRACAPRLCRKSAFGGTGILACPEFRLAMRIAAFLLLVLLAVSGARAEYIVLRSGQRLHVTGYQLLDDKYRLQLQGGWLDVQTAAVVSIEPEELFTPVPAQPAAAPAAAMSPYHELVAAAASRYGVDAELISSVMEVASHFDARAVSRKNARGLMSRR